MSTATLIAIGLACLVLSGVLMLLGRANPEGSHPAFMRSGWMQGTYPWFQTVLIITGVLVLFMGIEPYL